MHADSPQTFALDANCMVAAVCAWHQHHTPAKAEINRRLTRGERMVVPAHALVEAYSVVTRLPDPFRMPPADAWSVIEGSFVVKSELAAAREAGADVILTFNRRHFEPAAAGVAIVEPAEHPDDPPDSGG